jgi:hypothetical protein
VLGEVERFFGARPDEGAEATDKAADEADAFIDAGSLVCD